MPWILLWSGALYSMWLPYLLPILAHTKIWENFWVGCTALTPIRSFYGNSRGRVFWGDRIWEGCCHVVSNCTHICVHTPPDPLSQRPGGCKVLQKWVPSNSFSHQVDCQWTIVWHFSRRCCIQGFSCSMRGDTQRETVTAPGSFTQIRGGALFFCWRKRGIPIYAWEDAILFWIQYLCNLTQYW